MRKWQMLLLSLSVGLALAGAGRARAQSLRAAAGKVDITPTRMAYIAGYGGNRRSVGAHDPLMARCLVLDSGGTRIAIVSCDLIGMPRYRTLKVREMVKSVKPENVFVAATHTHSGPDTLGMWGPSMTQSGVDPAWMTETLTKIAKLVDATSAKLQPAIVKFANTDQVPRISKNIRVPQTLDKELGVVQFVSPKSGKPIATLVNYACHPEILNNHQMTADFPHWLYETVEGKTGAICLYLNGAQGGMITADYDEDTAPKGENWKAAETIGTSMGELVLKLTQNAEVVKKVPITVEHRAFDVTLENKRFLTFIKLHVFEGGELKNGNALETEVNRITLGPAEILTLPGEVLPNIGFYLKRQMRGHPKFLFGLCCDELGYILTPEDFGLELYSYESSVSVGPQIGALMEQNLRALMSESASAKK